MVSKLDHTEREQALEIREVFQASYAVEAELLKAKDFPPLKRDLDSFINAETTFYGFIDENKLAAAMEIKVEETFTHIQSLVVHPSFFRRGIGSKLLEFLFDSHKANLFIVETGADNLPAIKLYELFGFKLVKQWMTDIGIEKVGFEKLVN
ncbi:GNAT family N-acetyltransferase [Ekhidna sp.]